MTLKKIDRRTLLIAAGASVCLPQFALASGMIDYTPGLVRERLDAGETVLVDFAASWCSTCRRQERILQDLRAENAAYDAQITFIRVDWDEHGLGGLASALAVPRRSTLVLLRGDEELGRLIADTRRDAIAALLDLGLQGQG